MANQLSTRILHLHVTKSAGTAVRAALTKANGGTLRIFPHNDEKEYKNFDANDYDVFSGHFGFETAVTIGGDIITILRNPVDRFLSVYYFWRKLYKTKSEISLNTIIASKYSIDDFVMIKDEPFMLEELYNRATWQIACGSSLAHRRRKRSLGKTDQDILQMALANLRTFAVVGIQEDMLSFAHKFTEKFRIDINVERLNVTRERADIADVSVRTLTKIREWVHLDMELYANACVLAR